MNVEREWLDGLYIKGQQVEYQLKELMEKNSGSGSIDITELIGTDLYILLGYISSTETILKTGSRNVSPTNSIKKVNTEEIPF